MEAHRVLGTSNWRLGDIEQAEAHQRAALAIAETDGTPPELGHALIDLANTFTLGGADRIREAGELYDRAAKLFAEIHNPSAEARVLMNRGLLHHYSGEKTAALHVMAAALAAAERSRSPIWIGYCSVNLSQFHVEAHEIARAHEEIDHAAAILEPLGDHLAMQQITMIRGMVAEAEEKWPEAEALFDDAFDRARKLSLSAETAEMEFRQASLAARMGNVPRARLLLEASRKDGLGTLRPDLAGLLDDLEKKLVDEPARP